MQSRTNFTTAFDKLVADTRAPPVRNALMITFLWLNASEVFRYFIFVMPLTRTAMVQLTDPAPMNIPIFIIWGAWDTLLFVCVSLIVWLFFEHFGGGRAAILAAGTLVWAAVFGLFWLATWNMNMTQAAIPLIALPLALLEMVIAAAILERGWKLSRSAQESQH